MKAIGNRINEFNNHLTNVKEFNIMFKESQITGFNDDLSVTIGEITKNAHTRLLEVGDILFEHEFIQPLNSEKNYETSDDNDDLDLN
jgi:hypothetical protein